MLRTTCITLFSNHKLVGLLLSTLLLCACDSDPNRATDAAQSGTKATAMPPGLSLTNPRVMHPLPGKSITSGYFDLHNNRPDRAELISASSPDVRSIEIHEIVKNGDKVSMRRLSSVTIEPGATIQFASGGKHLMLFGVAKLPEKLDITLKFADGQETLATFQQQRW